MDGGEGKPEGAAQEKGAEEEDGGHPECCTEQQLGRVGSASKRTIRAHGGGIWYAWERDPGVATKQRGRLDSTVAGQRTAQ